MFAFEKANDLPLAGPGKNDRPPSDVSAKLLHGQGVASPWTWSWVVVHRAKQGETASLYHLQGGKLRKTFTAPVNTGVIQKTPLGTWPIYAQFRKTTMRGAALFPVPKHVAQRLRAKHAAGASWKSLHVVHVHGRVARRVHYDDPGIRWVSYFHGGDALHYIHRAHYGFPQSAGCVEMSYSNAHVMWVGTHIGTLVTVTGRGATSPAHFHASF